MHSFRPFAQRKVAVVIGLEGVLVGNKVRKDAHTSTVIGSSLLPAVKTGLTVLSLRFAGWETGVIKTQSITKRFGSLEVGCELRVVRALAGI
jgi:hypothetical protein